MAQAGPETRALGARGMGKFPYHRCRGLVGCGLRRRVNGRDSGCLGRSAAQRG
jgi:hypothetical protein